MNEEKNNIGIGNIGVNNSLPPMGTVQAGTNMNTNSVQDKYGLPPISNFTNFNNYYETPTVDNNTSVFDLMEQFESVNSGNVSNQNSINNVPVMPQMNTTNNPVVSTPSMNNAQSQVNNQSMPSIPVINNNPNTVVNQTPVNNMEAPFSMFSGNSDLANTSSVVYNEPSIPKINNPVNNNLNGTGEVNQNTNNDPLNIFGGNINNNVQNIPTGNQTNLQNDIGINQVGVSSNVGATQNIPSENNGVNSIIPEMNIPILNNIVDNGLSSINQANVQSNVGLSQNIPSDNNVVNSVLPEKNIPKINNDVQNYNFNDTMDNNEVVEIPTTSIDDSNSFGVDNTNIVVNNNDSNDNIEELITNFDNDIGGNTDTNEALVSNNTNSANTTVDTSVKPKKKKKKALFIILLIITLLIVGAVAILSYFMFFKEDKLVCGLQDYSNEQFILDESMVMKFKGNSLSTANFTQSLTFDSDHLDKKDSYLEELKNQYQGLGFNVSFVENEAGFDINMNFTKKELESWYGTSLKNSSKNQMKKEMRDSGYTCK